MNAYSKRSASNLEECEFELQDIFTDALFIIDHSITCGRRDEANQNYRYSIGESTKKWPDGKHNFEAPAFSRAVDAHPYPIDYENINRYHFFAGVVFAIAHERGIELIWGGYWKSLKDYGHWELRA